jgi:moderate conductance mechanosensitive channel
MNRMRLLSMGIVCALFLAFTPIASAQMLPSATSGDEGKVALPQPLTTEAVNALVSRLSETEVRALLLDQLEAIASEQPATLQGKSFFEFVKIAASSVSNSVVSSVKVAPLLWENQKKSFKTFHDKLGWDGIGALFGALLLSMAVGFTVEKLVNMFMRRRFNALLIKERPDTLLETSRFLFVRLMIELLGLVAFFVVTRNMATTLIPDNYLIFAETLMINLVVIPRLGAAVFRLILAPERPEFRLLNVDNADAARLFRFQVTIIVVMGLSVAITAFGEINGVPAGESRLGFWLNLLVHVYMIYVIWRLWDTLIVIMRGADSDISPVEEKVAQYYPIYTIGVVISTWTLTEVLIGFGRFDVLASSPQFKTILVLTVLPVFDTLLRGLVRHLTPPMTGEGAVAERAHLLTKKSYTRVGRVLVFATLVMVVASFWGMNPQMIAAAGLGAQFAGRFIEILMIIAVGYLAWELVTLWVNRKLAAEQTALGFDLTEDEPGGGEGGGVGGSRLSTVLPLVLGIAKFGIIAVFGLIALGNIGIDITPLLAGAGILGLAIGFGAQKLVADIVSGIFFLIDDAFRTGEYVSIEGTLGTVEKISIRSMQLRHHRGPVHTIPYGEIPKITNYSRDWVIMKLKFTVPFNTDPNKVKKIFKKIGNEMIEDEAWKDDFLQPFKSQGVFDFDDVGMIMRGKFMAKPGKQFTARKEIYNRVKFEFEAAGIDFARREVRVAIPGLEKAQDVTDEQKTMIAGVAGEVVAQQEQEKKDSGGG